jgi:hypothetical protein
MGLTAFSRNLSRKQDHGAPTPRGLAANCCPVLQRSHPGWIVADEGAFRNNILIGDFQMVTPPRRAKNAQRLDSDEEVQDQGKLDNRLIIYISNDNGTSAEGTLEETFNQMTAYNGILTLPEVVRLLHYENWGSETTYPQMSVAWSRAFDTPFKWTKQVASHFGGTRQGMAISWPGRISDVGGMRTQFHHMIDVVPTILEAAGIPAPDMVNGIKTSLWAASFKRLAIDITSSV